MTLLPGSKAAKIESLQAELLEANTNLSLSEEARTGLENALADAQVEVETLTVSLNSCSAELATITAEFEEYKGGDEARSHAAAQTILAGIGETPPIEEAGGEQGQAPQSLIAQYSALSGEAKTAFYQANKSGIQSEAEAIRIHK